MLNEDLLIVNELSEDYVIADEQKLADYCMDLYKFSAEQCLLENDPGQFHRLLELSHHDKLVAKLKLSLAGREFDEEEIGQGPVLKATLEFSTNEGDGEADAYINIADIYLTEEGMQDLLGVVDWFPEGMKLRRLGMVIDDNI